MRLLMLNSEFPPIGGGMGTVNHELLKQFSNCPDLEIDLITSAKGSKNETLHFAPNIKIIKHPIKLQNIHHFTNNELLKYVYSGLKTATTLHKEKKYDLCMAWSAVPAGGMAYWLNFFYKLPYIVRVSGVDIPGFEERYNNIYKVLKPIIKSVWRNADIVVTKCQQETDMILDIEKRVNIKKIFNGVDNSKFYGKQHKNSNNALRIVCVGRLIQRKGQQTLIESTALLKQKGVKIIVDLVGDGDELENYKKLAHDLKVLDNVNFLGYVERNKIASIYQNADVFVLPSYNEGMSNALLEAMACGLPVIVTNTGGTDELITEDNGFVIPFGNSKELAEKILYFHHSPNEIQRMGNAAREVTKQLSWNSIAESYKTIFQSVIT